MIDPICYKTLSKNWKTCNFF